MTRTERIAKIRRDLLEMKARLQRIESEVYRGQESFAELERDLKALETDDQHAERVS
jgi:hypothetical protein